MVFFFQFSQKVYHKKYDPVKSVLKSNDNIVIPQLLRT